MIDVKSLRGLQAQYFWAPPQQTTEWKRKSKYNAQVLHSGTLKGSDSISQSKSAMQMETTKPLQLKLHAISNHFDFKLNLRLKLSPPSPNPPKKSKSFKSRALRFLGKFQPRWSKFKPISVNQKASIQNPEVHVPANRPKQGKVAVGSIVVGLICLLCQFMYHKDSKWLIIACGLITLLYMAFVLREFTSRRVWDLLADVMVPVLVCSIGVYVANILKISHENVSCSVWKVVNYVGNLATSSGNLRHLKYGLAHIEDILLRCVT